MKTWLFFLTVLAFQASVAIAQTKQTLSIGGLFDLSSGAGALWGTAERNAFLLAVEQYKAKHPSLDPRCQIEDSAYSTQKSSAALQKLIAVDHVKYVIGPTWEVVVGTLPICEQNHVICIAPSCNNLSFDDPKLRYSFTFWFDDRGYSLVHAEYLNSHGIKKVAVIGAISPYYDALVDSIVDALKIKPVLVQRSLSTESDFRSVILKVPSDVEALVVFLLGDGAAQSFFKQWKELRKDRPLIFTDDTPLYASPPLLNLKEAGFKVLYSAPDLQSMRLEEFNKAYKEKFGEEPQAVSGSVAYDATMILLDCIEKSHPDTLKVAECIRATNNFCGVSGVLSFNGKNKPEGRKMKINEL